MDMEEVKRVADEGFETENQDLKTALIKATPHIEPIVRLIKERGGYLSNGEKILFNGAEGGNDWENKNGK